MESSSLLTNARLAFIALANEYCQAIENARVDMRADFIASMTRLLPRIYMAAADLTDPVALGEADEMDVDLGNALDESDYNLVSERLQSLFGADDVYLETFEADMKYSDTPIGASISESLADIYQELYNFTEMVKNVPVDMIPAAIAAVRIDFADFWSQTLVNVMRPLNHLRYNDTDASQDL